MSAAVHQFVPLLGRRDATGNHTLLLQDCFRRAGWSSDIFVGTSVPETDHLTRPYQSYASSAEPSDVLVYQLSTASPIADYLVKRRETLVVDYHNVTPPRHFEGWDERVVETLALAQRQTKMLAERTTLAIADSHFNAEDLRRAGYTRVEVVPVLFDPLRLDDVSPAAPGTAAPGTAAPGTAAPGVEPTAEVTAAPGAGAGVPRSTEQARRGARWLFVGRLAPPKAQHRLVMALCSYRSRYDPAATLTLVGAGGDRYADALSSFIGAAGVRDAVNVVTDADDHRLVQLYGSSDVFVSLSQHEGFGIPLVEAMAIGIPVVALASSAVAETVDGAGVILDRDDPELVAAAVRRVLTDPALREGLTAAGRRRAEDFSLARSQRAAIEALEALVR